MLVSSRPNKVLVHDINYALASVNISEQHYTEYLLWITIKKHR